MSNIPLFSVHVLD